MIPRAGNINTFLRKHNNFDLSNMKSSKSNTSNARPKKVSDRLNPNKRTPFKDNRSVPTENKQILIILCQLFLLSKTNATNSFKFGSSCLLTVLKLLSTDISSTIKKIVTITRSKNHIIPPYY